jgi:myosin heavy subunit
MSTSAATAFSTASTAVSEYVFIEDKQEVFVPALVINSNSHSGEVTVQDLTDDSRVIVLPAVRTYPIGSFEDLEAPPADLILLSVVHRPAILHTLRTRFNGDQIYTNVGAILVSINPFKKVEGLYSQSVMEAFSTTVVDDPHVFGVAQNAYDGLKRGKNQSLIIRYDFYKLIDRVHISCGPTDTAAARVVRARPKQQNKALVIWRL